MGMIETHILNTFLAGSAREASWFVWLTYFDGLIAPAFLFIAGYVQGLGMRQAGGRHRNWGKKLGRLGAVWLLGYALHFPAPQLLAGQWSEALRLGTQVDVLQCLAVSLAVLVALEHWARRSADVIVTVLLPLAVVTAEMVADSRFEPVWLLAYFNSSTGSLFPLLPWSGFVFAGFLASRVSVWVSWGSAMKLALIVAFAFFVGGANGFFAERLAWLLVAVPVVQWIAGRWQPRWLLFVGRESLVIYAAHLLLIETLAVSVLRRGGYDLAKCSGIFITVLAVSLLIAVLWGRARRAMRPRENSAPAA